MRPLLDQPEPRTQPWHSTPYQALPRVYIQNASLEIAWTRVPLETHTIAGDVLMPFITEGYEGFDINDPHDWMIAERLLADGAAALPHVGRPEGRRLQA
jgi:N-acylneuraminate cytidylyltransferase